MPLTITLPDELIERVVKEIMENFPEAAQCLSCTRWKYDQWRFRFEDREESPTKIYDLDKAKLLAAFPLMFTDKWPKGLQAPPASEAYERWNDWLCQSDCWSFDAFIQLACFGEVIYG